MRRPARRSPRRRSTSSMGLIHATQGTAHIFGLDCDRQAVAVKRTGYVPGELPQLGGWRGSEIVAYAAGLRGDVDDAHVAGLATRLALDLFETPCEAAI